MRLEKILCSKTNQWMFLLALKYCSISGKHLLTHYSNDLSIWKEHFRPLPFNLSIVLNIVSLSWFLYVGLLSLLAMSLVFQNDPSLTSDVLAIFNPQVKDKGKLKADKPVYFQNSSASSQQMILIMCFTLLQFLLLAFI
jgi:hypothetical protein